MMKKEYYISTISSSTAYYYCIEGDTVETISIYCSINTTSFNYSKFKANRYTIDIITKNYLKIQPESFKIMMQMLNWLKQWLTAKKIFNSYGKGETKETFIFDGYKLKLGCEADGRFGFDLTNEKSDCKAKLPPQINKISKLMQKIANTTIAYHETRTWVC